MIHDELDVTAITSGIVLVLFLYISYVAIAHRAYEPLPLLGHTHAFALRSRHYSLQWMLATSKHFNGQAWRIDVPLVGKGWFVNDPVILKYILSTRHVDFGKGKFFESRARVLFRDGILISTGASWHHQRKAGLSLISPTNLKYFTEHTLPKALHIVTDRLDEAAREGQRIDLEELVMNYSLAVFGELAFDAEWSRLSQKFSKSFHSASSLIAQRFTTPFYPLFESLLPHGRQLQRDLTTVHDFSLQLVREGLEEIREEEVGGREVKVGKGLLIRALVEEGVKGERELADSCLNFLTAGRDTTAQAITWTIYLLLIHPTYLRLLQNELSANPTTPPSDLPILQNILSESLRLHPPIPIEILENTSSQPILLPSSPFPSSSSSCSSPIIVNPGHQIIWSPYVMSRLPHTWGPDAETFRPERWDEMDKQPTSFENPVFHAGVRGCLGKGLARAEMGFVIKELVGGWEFGVGWNGERGRRLGGGLTGGMEGGLPVWVKKRGRGGVI